MNVKGTLIATLAAGYLLSATPVAQAHEDSGKGKSPSGDKSGCKGKDGCKGHGGKDGHKK